MSRPIASPVRRLIVLVLATGAALLEASACARDDGPGAVPGGSPPDAQAAAVPADAAKTERPGAHDDASPPGDASSEAAIDASSKPPFGCASDGTFPGSLPVAEASAAAEVELKPGVRELLIASDSGHSGAALLIALPSGVQRPITLPLDPGASDDIEGIAWRGGKLYTLTSSGAVRRFTPDGAGGLLRDQDAYPLGADPYACPDLGTVNCGKNYEGLCLRAPGGAHPCAGYAASKADGKLYCLTLNASGHLVASTSVPPLSLGLAADRLSDCAFGAANGPAADVLAVTTNVFGLSRTYRVDQVTGVLTKLPIAALLNVEATAIDRDGAQYVFDDNSSTTSTSAKATCVGW